MRCRSSTLPSAVLKEIPRAVLQISGVSNPENVLIQTVEEDAWNESTVTYNTAPPGVAELNVEESPVDSEKIHLDVTEFVRQQMAGDRVVSFRVEAKSKGGAVKGGQSRLIVGPEDTMAYPSMPTGLKATKTEDGIRIEWNASPEADLKSYSLYRDPRVDKEVAAFSGLVDNLFVDRLVKSGQEYTYCVTAVDTGTRESAPSEKVTVSVP